MGEHAGPRSAPAAQFGGYGRPVRAPGLQGVACCINLCPSVLKNPGSTGTRLMGVEHSSSALAATSCKNFGGLYGGVRTTRGGTRASTRAVYGRRLGLGFASWRLCVEGFDSGREHQISVASVSSGKRVCFGRPVVGSGLQGGLWIGGFSEGGQRPRVQERLQRSGVPCPPTKTAPEKPGPLF